MYKIGIDEAGRGSWLGPVVACSICFNPNNMPDVNFLNKLNDSKKLTQRRRNELYNNIIYMSCLKPEPNLFFGVGVVDNFLIDEINIKQANKEAIRKSLIEIIRKIEGYNYINISGKDFISNQSKFIDSVFIDGKDNYEFNELLKNPSFVISGDSKIKEISCASIIAKVFRDNLLITYSSLYPDLGIENHKGYGTKKHMEFLKNKSSVTGIHRLSYKPIKNILDL